MPGDKHVHLITTFNQDTHHCMIKCFFVCVNLVRGKKQKKNADIASSTRNGYHLWIHFARISSALSLDRCLSLVAKSNPYYILTLFFNWRYYVCLRVSINIIVIMKTNKAGKKTLEMTLWWRMKIRHRFVSMETLHIFH